MSRAYRPNSKSWQKSTNPQSIKERVSKVLENYARKRGVATPKPNRNITQSQPVKQKRAPIKRNYVKRAPQSIKRTDKLYGRNKVVNNQLNLVYQTKEQLTELVNKRGNYETASDDYHELLSQAFKVARGLKYEDERKYVNPNYRGKGNQIKSAKEHELSGGEEVKQSVKKVESRNKAQIEANNEIKENLVDGKKASILGEIVKANRIMSKEYVEFARIAGEAAGRTGNELDRKLGKYENAEEEVDEDTQKRRDRQALRNFNDTGSLGGLQSTVSRLQENIVSEIIRGSSIHGIAGDAELGHMIAELDIQEVYALSLHKDFDVIFITSERDIDKSTVNNIEETATRDRILRELKSYIELKREGKAGPLEFASVLKIQQESFY